MIPKIALEAFGAKPAAPWAQGAAGDKMPALEASLAQSAVSLIPGPGANGKHWKYGPLPYSPFVSGAHRANASITSLAGFRFAASCVGEWKHY
jgi:hypothetical protein